MVGDHVDPGQTFQVLAAFIEPGVDVPITVVTGSSVFDLGSASVDAAGRFDVSLTLPPEVPHGYAELHLDQPNEGDAATVFLVGPREGRRPPRRRSRADPCSTARRAPSSCSSGRSSGSPSSASC